MLDRHSGIDVMLLRPERSMLLSSGAMPPEFVQPSPAKMVQEVLPVPVV